MKQLLFLAVILFSSITYGQWTQVGASITGEASFDNSGRAVAMSNDGSIIAIGAPSNDGNGNSSGHVRVYRNGNGSWTQISDDIDGKSTDNFLGASISMNGDGSIIAVGAPGNDEAALNAGCVKVYKDITGTWTQIGTDIQGKAESEFMGNSVNINDDGSIVVIGIPAAAPNGTRSGTVRVYENAGGIWTQIGDDINGDNENDNFGIATSINDDGTIIAVGATGNDSVKIYKNQAGIWTQIGSDLVGENSGDFFGRSVSLNSDGTIIAVGAPFYGVGGNSIGHTKIYQNIAGSWTQIGQNIDGAPTTSGSSNSHFVDLNDDGNIVAIGDTTNATVGTNAGHVSIYQNIAGTWTKLGNDINGEAAFNESGSSVSLSADGAKVAIGSPFNDGNGTDVGHVRIFENNAVLSNSKNTTIDGLRFYSKSGKVYTNLSNIEISIHTLDGKHVSNTNLSGVFIVGFKDNKGYTEYHKVVVE